MRRPERGDAILTPYGRMMLEVPLRRASSRRWPPIALYLLVMVTSLAGLPVRADPPLVPYRVPEALEKPKELALPVPVSPIRRQLAGTGFFVDESGHLITARHVVESCRRILVSKEQHRIAGRLLSSDARLDLALIKIPKTLGIAAVFPGATGARINDMVFAGAYDRLAGLRIGGGVLANARVTGGGEGGMLAIDAPLTFGASGAPVLDRLGLVQGVVSRRTAKDRVLAVSAADAKAFLAARGIHALQDDRPQISGATSRADRAASISARVTCLQE